MKPLYLIILPLLFITSCGVLEKRAQTQTTAQQEVKQKRGLAGASAIVKLFTKLFSKKQTKQLDQPKRAFRRPGKPHPNGGGFVADTAKVDETVYVGPNAQVLDNARVSGNARIEDNARVLDNARVYDDAKVYGDAEVFENAHVYEIAEVYGNAKVLGKKIIRGNWSFGMGIHK